MPDVVNIGKNARDVTASTLQLPYSKVSIIVDENTVYEKGNDTGLTLEITCPWGTQAMANSIYNQINGYQYQPVTVTDAVVNPAVELGDAIQANGVYTGMYQQDATYGRTFYSDFSAPIDEEINHEYSYESETDRKIVREHEYTKSQLSIQDEKIEAKVSQTGGASSTFGWSLVSTGFTLNSGSKTVFSCDKTGITVSGIIRATSGLIGGTYSNGTWSGGFTIEKNKMWSGQNGYTGGSTAGVYVGTDGIGLGNGNFYVSKAGSLVAKSGSIGSGSKPWTIGTNGIYRGKTTFDSTDSGIFIGDSGISLGKGVKKSVITIADGNSIPPIANRKTGVIYHRTDNNRDYYWNGSSFVVATETDLWKYTAPLMLKSDGKIIAQSISISDNVTFVDSLGATSSLNASKLTDNSITSGKLGGGSVTESKIGSKAVSKGKTSSGVQTSLDNGDTAMASFNSLISGSVTATWIRTSSMDTKTLRVANGNVYLIAGWHTKTVGDTSITYLGRA